MKLIFFRLIIIIMLLFLYWSIYPWYTISYNLFTCNIKLYNLLVILLLFYFVIEYKEIKQKKVNEFYHFIFWILIIITMFDYILIIINLSLIHIAYNMVLTKLLLSCFILLFLIYYFNRKKTKVTIEDLGIKYGLDLIPFIVLFFGLYIFGLFYIRFYNFGKCLDLKVLYNTFMIFFKTQEYNYIIITIFFYILLLIIFLILFNIIIKSIKLNLFKTHIYIKSFFDLGVFTRTRYNKITQNYFLFYMKLSCSFSSLISFLQKLLYIYILGKRYDPYKSNAFRIFLVKIRDKNALIILILLLLYDILFNNVVLTKMYYFLPFLFLYNIIILINDILIICEPFEEGVIASHLYFNIKTFNMDTFKIQYTNNFEATIEDLKDIEYKLNNYF